MAPLIRLSRIPFVTFAVVELLFVCALSAECVFVDMYSWHLRERIGDEMLGDVFVGKWLVGNTSRS